MNVILTKEELAKAKYFTTMIVQMDYVKKNAVTSLVKSDDFKVLAKNQKDFYETRPTISDIILISDNKTYPINFALATFEQDLIKPNKWGITIHYKDLPVTPDKIDQIVITFNRCILKKDNNAIKLEFINTKDNSVGNRGLYSWKTFKDKIKIKDDSLNPDIDMNEYITSKEFHLKHYRPKKYEKMVNEIESAEEISLD